MKKRHYILGSLAVVVLTPVIAAALTWGDRALPGGDPLPPKFADWRMPDVEANMVVYLLPDAPIPLRSLTDETGAPIAERRASRSAPAEGTPRGCSSRTRTTRRRRSIRLTSAAGRAGTERTCPCSDGMQNGG